MEGEDGGMQGRHRWRVCRAGKGMGQGRARDREMQRGTGKRSEGRVWERDVTPKGPACTTHPQPGWHRATPWPSRRREPSRGTVTAVGRGGEGKGQRWEGVLRGESSSPPQSRQRSSERTFSIQHRRWMAPILRSNDFPAAACLSPRSLCRVLASLPTPLRPSASLTSITMRAALWGRSRH